MTPLLSGEPSLSRYALITLVLLSVLLLMLVLFKIEPRDEANDEDDI